MATACLRGYMGGGDVWGYGWVNLDRAVPQRKTIVGEKEMRATLLIAVFLLACGCASRQKMNDLFFQLGKASGKIEAMNHGNK